MCIEQEHGRRERGPGGSPLLLAMGLALLFLLGCQKDITGAQDIAGPWSCRFRSGMTTQQGHTTVTFDRSGGVSSVPSSGGSFRGRYTIVNGTADVRITSSRQDALNPVAEGEVGVATLTHGGGLQIEWGGAPEFSCEARP